MGENFKCFSSTTLHHNLQPLHSPSFVRVIFIKMLYKLEKLLDSQIMVYQLFIFMCTDPERKLDDNPRFLVHLMCWAPVDSHKWMCKSGNRKL